MSPDRILEIGYAFRKSKALLSAVERGLFAALAEGPQGADALSRRLGLHGRGARAFFDALAAPKLLDRDEGRRYTNAPDCSVSLAPNQPPSIADLVHSLNIRI